MYIRVELTVHAIGVEMREDLYQRKKTKSQDQDDTRRKRVYGIFQEKIDCRGFLTKSIRRAMTSIGIAKRREEQEYIAIITNI